LIYSYILDLDSYSLQYKTIMETNNNLQRLLMSLDANSDKDKIKLTFEEIAMELFNNYHIQKGKQEYYFMNIEFYFFNKGHQDIITYPRHLTEGKWFFHSSGVDLTFKSQLVSENIKEIDANTDFFGGILIRSLVRKSEEKITLKGPHICEWEIFDEFDALSPMTRVPYIESNKSLGYTNDDIKKCQCKRVFSYKGDKIDNKYNELNQKFKGIDLSLEQFETFLKMEYAYKINEDELRKRINSL